MASDSISIPRRRPSYSYFSGCMSPSCVPVREEYSHIKASRSGGGGARDQVRAGRRWRKLVKKVMSEGKSIYGPRPLTFQYDAVSYSQNFDEGNHKFNEEYLRPCPQVFRDRRWQQQSSCCITNY